MGDKVQPDVEHVPDVPEVVAELSALTPDAESVEEVAEPSPADVLPPDPNDTDLPHADLDTRSPESVLTTRGNIVSDGPGTVGY